MTDATAPPSNPSDPLLRTHLRFGWALLLVFLVLGAALEAFHALKWPVYLSADNETRRLMWTLAHAHGALLGLIHIAFAVSVPHLSQLSPSSLRLTSRMLIAAAVFLPLGFILGGSVVTGGDPSIGILLVPVGALALFGGVALCWRGIR